MNLHRPTLKMFRPREFLKACALASALSILWGALQAFAVDAPASVGDGTTPAVSAAPPFPRIAMLWSPGERKKKRSWEDYAQHSLILVSTIDIGLKWEPNPFPGMSEVIKEESIVRARQNLAEIRRLNPLATVVIETYFFEARDGQYAEDSPWWRRDREGKRPKFWPGTYMMDLSSQDYVEHIARKIEAVYRATDCQTGLFLDNVRLNKEFKAAWTQFLGVVRDRCGDIPILVNAGWNSKDLEWIAPLVNGIMYEDAVAHAVGKDTEAYYGQIAQTDQLLRSPHISVNERFGNRDDAGAMLSEFYRTLVYTDMHFLYSDSTNTHDHSWWPQWSVALGAPVSPCVSPAPGGLARREFERGTVLWLPASAVNDADVSFERPLAPFGSSEAVREIRLQPGTGALLTRQGE